MMKQRWVVVFLMVFAEYSMCERAEDEVHQEDKLEQLLKERLTDESFSCTVYTLTGQPTESQKRSVLQIGGFHALYGNNASNHELVYLIARGLPDQQEWSNYEVHSIYGRKEMDVKAYHLATLAAAVKFVMNHQAKTVFNVLREQTTHQKLVYVRTDFNDSLTNNHERNMNYKGGLYPSCDVLDSGHPSLWYENFRGKPVNADVVDRGVVDLYPAIFPFQHGDLESFHLDIKVNLLNQLKNHCDGPPSAQKKWVTEFEQVTHAISTSFDCDVKYCSKNKDDLSYFVCLFDQGRCENLDAKFLHGFVHHEDRPC